MATLKARLVEARDIAPEVRHFVFDVPEVEQLPYLPGQFVSFSRDFNGKKITRAYSTASPCNENRFELCLNRVEDGLFSPHLFAMRPGDTVDVKGPLGYFTWKFPVNDSILVATGTELRPFAACCSPISLGWERTASLVYGVRYESSLLYFDEFQQMAVQHPNFYSSPH
ncbi:MAG: FAD-binding oxidoreductase [Bryobacteraceae bacterium]